MRFVAAAAVLTAVLSAAACASEPAPTDTTAIVTLPALYATPIQVDTGVAGGYARGSWTEALNEVAADLAPAERNTIGRALDRIFDGALRGDGLDEAGRLRIAYERVRRPDGTTRSVRVLAAEVAVRGSLHTALFYEQGGRPGYYDPFGRSLQGGSAWAQPVVAGRVSSGFNARRLHPILRRLLPHLGVDYAAAHGTPVRATGDGHVAAAGPRGGYGNLVEVQHANGYATRYAHLSRIAVRRGAPVRQGEVIGYVGMTGLATGPHLHYEVRRAGRAVDPLVATASAGPVSELPRTGDWSHERRELVRLLARAPSLVRTARAVSPF